jgi:hypothetical protein
MDTFLAFAAVIILFVLLALPTVAGQAHERRITRQLRAAQAAHAAAERREAARRTWHIAA